MKRILILIMCILICSCSSSKKFSYTAVSNEEAINIMSKSKYVIIDVRTKEEYAESHLVDAINIPYDKIREEYKGDKKTKIFVYCRSGRRSKIAAEELIKMGYEVYDLGSFNTIDLTK